MQLLPATVAAPHPTHPAALLVIIKQVAGYKVKVMLAEPKTRRGSSDAAYLGLAGRGTPGLPQGLLAGMGVPSPYAAAAANASLLSSLNPGLVNQGCVLVVSMEGGCPVWDWPLWCSATPFCASSPGAQEV